MINNFDAHMFSSSLPGICYYFINKDYNGALNSPYSYIYTIILYLSVFAILKSIVKVERAYLFTIFFPISRIVADTVALPNDCQFMAGLFMLFFFLKWYNKSSIRNSFFLWLFAEISIFIALDIGVAFGLPALIMAFFVIIKNHKFNKIIEFIVPGFFLTAVSVGVFFTIKDDTVTFRYWIKRFLNVVLSSQNWSSSIVSVQDKVKYYIIFPILFFLTSFIMIKFAKTVKNATLSLIFLILSFVMNSSRTIVRHNINENKEFITCYMVLGFTLIIIIIADNILNIVKNVNIFKLKLIESSLINKNNRLIKDYRINSKELLKVLMSIWVVVLLGMLSDNNYKIVKRQVQNVNNYLVDNEDNKENKEINNMSNDLDFILSNIINDDETFFDFANYTNIFSYVNRQNPVYVNQCPALINGEFGQKEVLFKLKENREQIPIVLMWVRGDRFGANKLDGILNIDRYYLITEYIYNNYKPFYFNENYEIWCDIDRYDEMKLRINQNNLVKDVSIFDYRHELGHIPYLWANKDKKAIESYTLFSFKDDSNHIEKEDGNYIVIKADARHDINDFELKINYSNGSNEIYQFNLLKGVNYYKIRISTDYDWFISDIYNIEFSGDDSIYSLECYYAKGD